MNRETWLAIQRSSSVKVALRKKANAIARRAAQNAAEAHVDTEITVTEGVRPKGRPYVRVASSNGAAEHGTSWTTRARVLGRAIAGKRIGQ